MFVDMKPRSSQGNRSHYEHGRLTSGVAIKHDENMINEHNQ